MANLYRTISSTNSSWTFSTWMKISINSSNQYFFQFGGDSGSSRVGFYISGSTKAINMYVEATTTLVDSTNLLRDPAAWYHVVIKNNAGTGTVYVNGTALAGGLASFTCPSLSAAQLNVGYGFNTLPWYGGLAHTHLADGTAYDPTTFAETDATSGIWIAKSEPSVTYGTDGFFLKYVSGAITTDSSGNGNTMTQSGTITANKDSPDNNFCTWTPLLNRVTNSSTFTNGNTTVKNTNANWGSLGGTLLAKNGKWYYEAIGGNTTGPGYMHYGFASVEYFAMGGGSAGVQGEPGTVINYPSYTYYGYNGDVYYNTTTSNGQTSSYGATYANTDYIGVFLDLDNGKMYWSKNGAIQNSGTGITIDNANSDFWTPITGTYSDATGHDTNFGNGVFGTTTLGGTTYQDENGQGMFKYSPNDGGASSFDGSAKDFYALCTKNIKLYGG